MDSGYYQGQVERKKMVSGCFRVTQAGEDPPVLWGDDLMLVSQKENAPLS